MGRVRRGPARRAPGTEAPVELVTPFVMGVIVGAGIVAYFAGRLFDRLLTDVLPDDSETP